jgi:hypothetical protein
VAPPLCNRLLYNPQYVVPVVKVVVKCLIRQLGDTQINSPQNFVPGFGSLQERSSISLVHVQWRAEKETGVRVQPPSTGSRSWMARIDSEAPGQIGPPVPKIDSVLPYSDRAYLSKVCKENFSDNLTHTKQHESRKRHNEVGNRNMIMICF